MTAPSNMRLTQKAAEAIERHGNGTIRLTSAKNRSHAVAITLIVLVAITVFTFVRMDFGHTDIAAAANQSLADFWAMVGQPALDPPLGASHFTWETVISSTITTIAITAITTIISAITAPCFSAWLLPAI